nr:alpha-2-macroglobulin [Pseudomonadota bacterium]
MTAPTEARGNTTLPITYQTEQPAKIVVYAVDDGILRVSNYDTPDPLAFFFQKRVLAVDTRQIADLILPKFIADREKSAVGGDGGAASLQLYLNPFKRKNIPAVVYWSGLLDSNSTPQKLNFPLPNYFNGTLRIMAVAVNQSAVGSLQQDTLVQNDFIIKPNTPTFAAPGDQFDISVGIINKVKASKALRAEVMISPSANLQLTGEQKQSLVLDENQETTLHFSVKALKQLGNASLDIKVTDTNQHVSVQQTTLSIRPAIPSTTHLISGYTKNQKIDLPTPDVYYSEHFSQTLMASNNSVIFVTGLNRYLENYPYECTEQLTSRAFSRLVTQTVATSDMASLVNKILTRQNDQDSFDIWPGMAGNDRDMHDRRFVSIYTMHFLTEARLAKIEVSKQAFDLGLDYLREFAAESTTDLAMARLQAYAIYVLTCNEIVTSNYLTELQIYLDQNAKEEWQRDILSAYVAATYQLLRDETTAKRLIGGYTPQQSTTTTFYSPVSNDAQYLYLVAKHFSQRL